MTGVPGGFEFGPSLGERSGGIAYVADGIGGIRRSEGELKSKAGDQHCGQWGTGLRGVESGRLEILKLSPFGSAYNLRRPGSEDMGPA